MAHIQLSVEEREEIQLGLWRRESVRLIAQRLGRSHSTIVREINKNRPASRRQYTPQLAHERALAKRTCRGREERLKSDAVRTYVVAQLKRRRSPEQIAGRIRHDLGETVSHEAIYQFIYAQIHRSGYGGVKPGCEDLRGYLRRRRKRRIPHGARRCQRALKPHGPSVDERPVVVECRSRFGDWESDTVEGKDRRSGLNTLVERKSGLVFITRLTGKTGGATRAAIVRRLAHVPEGLRRTATFDNGPENRDWQPLETALGLRCFFAHPYCSWERGTNENTNGLIRDYFPKGTDFRTISDEEIAFVERELNERPRKRHGFRSPLEVWSGAIRG